MARGKTKEAPASKQPKEVVSGNKNLEKRKPKKSIQYDRGLTRKDGYTYRPAMMRMLRDLNVTRVSPDSVDALNTLSAFIVDKICEAIGDHLPKKPPVKTLVMRRAIAAIRAIAPSAEMESYLLASINHHFQHRQAKNYLHSSPADELLARLANTDDENKEKTIADIINEQQQGADAPEEDATDEAINLKSDKTVDFDDDVDFDGVDDDDAAQAEEDGNSKAVAVIEEDDEETEAEEEEEEEEA